MPTVSPFHAQAAKKAEPKPFVSNQAISAPTMTILHSTGGMGAIQRLGTCAVQRAAMRVARVPMIQSRA